MKNYGAIFQRQLNQIASLRKLGSYLLSLLHDPDIGNKEEVRELYHDTYRQARSRVHCLRRGIISEEDMTELWLNRSEAACLCRNCFACRIRELSSCSEDAA